MTTPPPNTPNNPPSSAAPFPTTTAPMALQPNVHQHTWPARPQPITYMDTQMLRLLGADKPVAEIANIFHIEKDECEYRLQHLYQKLESPTAEAALEKAKALSLI